MKKRLRLLAWVLTLTMLCELLPFGAVAQSDVGQELALAVAQNLELDKENGEAVASGTCGVNVTWNLSSDGVLTISGTGAMEDYKDYFLESLPWYNFLSSIKIAIINHGVTHIGNCSFDGCTSLAIVSMPQSVISIGDHAFAGCTSLVTIELPESTISIGNSAFDGCISLTAINIPENITSISDSIFYDCASLTSVSIPESVTSIGRYAFRGCTSLASIKIPEAVTSIGYSAFADCASFTTIRIPEAVTAIEDYTFAGCTSLISVSIPKSILSIREYAFAGCTSLTAVDIPESVISIGDAAFAGCTSLVAIKIPEFTISIGDSAFYGCTFLASITIPDSVTSIGRLAFDSCTSLTSITIPKFVTSISYATFYGCTSLTSIIIPESITSIESYAFDGRIPLSDVYYAGTQEQWNAIRVSSFNYALQSATIHYQSTGPEDENSFTFGRDNLGFLNTDNPVFLSTYHINYGFSPNGDYSLSNQKRTQLLHNLSPVAKAKIKIHLSQKWGGSCLGMALVTALRYFHSDRLPLDGFDFSNSSPSLYSLLPPRESLESQDLINYYQLSQYLPSYSSFEKARSRYCKTHTQEAIADIIQSLANHTPVLACLKEHAIVLLELNKANETSEYYSITVYDPNSLTPRNLKLFKNSSNEISIEYESGIENITKMVSYSTMHCYAKLADDLDTLDLRNYFQIDDNESQAFWPDSSIDMSGFMSADVTFGAYHIKIENGAIVNYDIDMSSLFFQFFKNNPLGDTSESTFSIHFPSVDSNVPFDMAVSGTDGQYASVLLNDTLLSISTSGPVKLAYNEAARTVDVTAEDATDVNLLFTQNETSENWPWHSWALDTTGTTTLHAELDDDGLHLSGDGITNAKYATENADTENVDSGTISVQPDADGITAVTITSTNDTDGDKTEVKPDSPTEPTEPAANRVNISGGTITHINGEALPEPVISCDTKEGDIITITADTEEGFLKWDIKEGDITLEDASASTTTFTMGKKEVVIKAQYTSPIDPTPTPTPTPGGGGSSGGGGGGGGGAAIVLGVGVAAAVTAGVILAAPVEVKGRVELADHSAIAGAKVSLLQNGSVVAQTTADENGIFSLKAKRGSYELTVAYTDANGQIIHNTISIKAPAKDLTITF